MLDLLRRNNALFAPGQLWVKNIEIVLIQSNLCSYSNKSLWFRKGFGTRDAVGVVKTPWERSLEHENEVYICFGDFEKAFDRVDWVKMFETLKSLHIDWRDRRLLQDLYMRQEAVVGYG